MGSRGSLNGNSIKIRELKKKLKLSETQKAVLIGKILGDGCLIPTATSRNYRLKVEHQAKHKEYVLWAAEVFGQWVISDIKFSQNNNSWVFKTISHPEITKFHEIFYENRRKIIPKKIKNFLLNPLSLAVWIMDDGSLSYSRKTMTISSHSFSKSENLLLIEALKKNFNLEANLNWDGKGYRLYFPVSTAESLVKIISPFVLPVMRYKLPLTP